MHNVGSGKPSDTTTIHLLPTKKKGISAARKVIQPEGGNKNHEHRSVQPSVRFRNYGLNNIVMMYVLKDNSDEDRICLTF